MATWIIHLRIAEIMLEEIPGLNDEKFALGSVAPDSGKPDEKWETFSPSTLLTHFQDAQSTHRRCADLEFFRDYLLPLGDDPDQLTFSLRLGYFFHLVTDNLWSKIIGLPTQQRWQAEFAADQDFIWEIKKDWYGLDFIYLRNHPDSLFWRVFRYAHPDTGGLPFLVPDSLTWSVNHIQQYYQRTAPEIQELYNRPYIYLSGAEADRFVEETSLRLAHAYEQLWVCGFSVDGAVSVLDLNI